MSNLVSQRENLSTQSPLKLSLKSSLRGFRFFPYLVLGALIFSFNAALDTHYLLKTYLVLVETQLGIVGLYLLMARMGKR